MTKLDQIVEQYPDTDILKCDGFDNCVLGYEYNWDGNIRLIYSIDKIITQLIEDDGMDVDEGCLRWRTNANMVSRRLLI